jgi:hypothetical protein
MNFMDLTHLAHLPWLILQPSIASTMIIYDLPSSPLPFRRRIFIVKVIYELYKKFFNKNIYIRLVVMLVNFRKIFLAKHSFLLETGPQLTVVSCPLGRNPFDGGI